LKSFFPGRRFTVKEFSIIPEALIWLMISRIRVSLLHSGRYLSTSVRAHPVRFSQVTEHDYLVVAKVINGLASRTPWSSTCLVKALAAHRMLAMRGIKSKIHLGVKKSDSKELEAHAWLSVDGTVIIGGENMHEYREVTSL
jgi:hypothetical protein